ncbi:MAG: ribosome maturation factor RimP [Lachnospiraceae bacterium]|nr:ribosome maturation factor RimP [Lachnospiraceae bacterium]
MAKREDYESMTEQIVTPITNEHQFELVDVEYVKEGSNWYLRVYIDKPGGITIDDCELVSRALSDILDEKDFISDAYILEVSSPGLSRPLKKEKDFARSIGMEVEIKLYKPVNKRKDYCGVLKAYDADTVTIEEDEEIVLNRSDIALIRLAFDF